MLFCACAPAYGESKPSLRIGAVFSVTGRSSAIGVVNKNTLLLVPEQVNRTGGIDVIGTIIMPATTPRAPLNAKENSIIEFTFTPINAAALGLKDVALIALPISVLVKKR